VTGRRDQGFSLVLVLLVIAALSLGAALFLQAVRGYGRAVSAASAAATLEAQADAGVQIAIFDLAASARDGRRSRRIPVNGAVFHCAFASGPMLRLQVQDDAGRVDLNVGSDRLIQALVRGLRIEKAEAIADAILDYRDSDDNRRPSGAEADEYAAAGRKSGPRNAPFLAIAELGQVLGMTPETAALLRPHLTLNSGLEGIDPAAARADLVEIIARGERGGQVVELQGLRDRPDIPQELRSTSMRRSFKIVADVRTGSARYVREVMIELTNSRARPFIVRGWARGDGSVSGPLEAPFPETAPGC
jgi:general secretion pathway protein K